MGMVVMCVAVMAQGKITGRVYDAKSGEAIEYAQVTLHKISDTSLVTGAATLQNGSFAIDKVPYGSYLMRVSFMGYKTYMHATVVKLSEQHPTLNVGKIQISPTATMLEAAEVVAERSMVEYQLDKRVINVDKNIVSGGGTASDVLEQVPSVSIDNDGNVSLRGSSNVKVLINGRPSELLGNDIATLLEQIPASTVENVEVITNPSAKYDPEGMSGIINIKLKDKSHGALGFNGIATLNVGSPLPFSIPDPLPAFIPTGNGSLNINYTTKKYNIFFNLDGGARQRGMHSQSVITRKRNNIPWSSDSSETYSVRGGRNASMKVGAEYYIDSSSSILFSYQLRGGIRGRESMMFSNDLLNSNYLLAYCGPIGLLDYMQTDTNSSRSVNNTFNLSYVKRFAKNGQEFTADATFSMRHVLGSGIQEQSYSIPASHFANWYLRESMSENHHQSLNLKFNYVHPFAEVWKLETGYEGRLDWPDQNAEYYRTEYDAMMNKFHYFDSISSTHFDYNQQVHAAYATVGGKINDKLSAQAGMRVEYSYLLGYDVNHPATDSVHKSYWQPYPTLHLSYEIDKHNSMQLSYSRRVRRPHMWDLNPYLEVREGQELGFGNPNLDPEFTNAYELSYNLSLDKWNIYTCAYYRQTNNMMTRYGFVWDSASQQRYSWWMPYNDQYDGYWASTWQNLDRGYNYGLEFIVDYQVFKWWKVNMSVNLYQSVIEGTQLLDNTTQSAFQASGKFSSYMMLPKDWTIQLSGQYWAPWLDLQTQMYSNYWCDLAVKKDVLKKQGTINLRIGDVLHTSRFGHETFNNQLDRVVKGRRLGPVFTIGFSYKINNGLKTKPAEQQDSGDDGGEY